MEGKAQQICWRLVSILITSGYSHTQGTTIPQYRPYRVKQPENKKNQIRNESGFLKTSD
jgi:hypothetical protein